MAKSRNVEYEKREVREQMVKVLRDLHASARLLLLSSIIFTVEFGVPPLFSVSLILFPMPSAAPDRAVTPFPSPITALAPMILIPMILAMFVAAVAFWVFGMLVRLLSAIDRLAEWSPAFRTPRVMLRVGYLGGISLGLIAYFSPIFFSIFLQQLAPIGMMVVYTLLGSSALLMLTGRVGEILLYYRLACKPAAVLRAVSLVPLIMYGYGYYTSSLSPSITPLAYYLISLIYSILPSLSSALDSIGYFAFYSEIARRLRAASSRLA